MNTKLTTIALGLTVLAGCGTAEPTSTEATAEAAPAEALPVCTPPHPLTNETALALIQALESYQEGYIASCQLAVHADGEADTFRPASQACADALAASGVAVRAGRLRYQPMDSMRLAEGTTRTPGSGMDTISFPCGSYALNGVDSIVTNGATATIRYTNTFTRLGTLANADFQACATSREGNLARFVSATPTDARTKQAVRTDAGDWILE